MRRIFKIARRLDTVLRAFPKLRQKVDNICVEYHQIQENYGNYDLNTDGERWLLKTLARHDRLRNVFDVGANHGDWAEAALQANPSATVHCFEICPPTFQVLAKRFSNGQAKGVRLNPVGLSDTPGEIKVKYCPDQDGLTTLFEVIHTPNVQIVTGNVVRGKDYCTDKQVSSIDLLKIDVEGAEHLVLRGFDDLLVPDKVSVVQFEYGLGNIMTKFLLRDFYSYLEQRGYRIGKLFPESIRFREYRFQDEDFIGPNYVAASGEMAALLSRG
jgi:FkbM family methyltransferase